MQEVMADFCIFRLFIIFLTSLDVTFLKESSFGMILYYILEMLS